MRVFIGLGANIPSIYGAPLQSVQWAIKQLKMENIQVVTHSDWYGTRAMGQEGQRDYINGVALLETSLPPRTLLRVLQRIEQKSGRQRGKIWGERSLDLDIISYGDVTLEWHKPWKFSPQKRKRLILPHPEAHKRPFVMKPLQDIASNWKHPIYGKSARQIWQGLKCEKEGRILQYFT
jgi:2-amino-4-hydroxy-6-hydroxymethyldihydropteridine diphosphokinase